MSTGCITGLLPTTADCLMAAAMAAGGRSGAFRGGATGGGGGGAGLWVALRQWLLVKSG